MARHADDALIEFGLVARVPAMQRWAQYQKQRDYLKHREYSKPRLGERHEPPVSALNPVVDPDPGDPRIGICCSGGGIRSASFNLGALQAIQDAGRLQKVRFLSAVSGGSYIASAFAMVAKTRDEQPRDPPGDDSDPKLVRPPRNASDCVSAQEKRLRPGLPFHRGSPEEQYLRNRASYMAPTGAAKAYLVWRVLLGLVVNLVLIGAFIALVAAGLAVWYRSGHPGLIRPPRGDELGASPDAWIWGSGLAIAGVGLLMGALSIVARPRKHSNARRILELLSLPVFGIGLLLFTLEMVVPELIDVLRDDLGTLHPATGTVDGEKVGVGISASVAGIIAAIIAQLRAQVADPIKAAREAQSALAKLAPRVRLALIYLATAILGPLIILALLVAATMIQVETTKEWLQLAIPAVALAVLAWFMRFGDLNSWSLHPFYRSRLCTAFALRRVSLEGDPPEGRAEARKEGELVPLSATHVRPESPPYEEPDWPTLIVCAAANVSDPGASPPGRGVTSFTFTAAEMGGPLVGGIETEFFEGKLARSRQRDFTLPAAVAMSGAAVAPSMGKLTRPSIRFLMAMANLRLGVWLPNPRRMESFVGMRNALRTEIGRQEIDKGYIETVRAAVRPASYRDSHFRRQALIKATSKQGSVPRPTPVYLIKELLGLNSINDKFLYVTDGGHYENLGLVELLRRGCTSVYCFDASGGRPLAQLGDAIALARSELGVKIDFPDGELERLAETDGLAERACATGTITYERYDPPVTGRIVYVPTVMTSGLPWDIHALKAEDDAFPRHSTMDQLFTDQKFEAYRTLGYYGASAAMEAMDGARQGDNGKLASGKRTNTKPPRTKRSEPKHATAKRANDKPAKRANDKPAKRTNDKPAKRPKRAASG